MKRFTEQGENKLLADCMNYDSQLQHWTRLVSDTMSDHGLSKSEPLIVRYRDGLQCFENVKDILDGVAHDQVAIAETVSGNMAIVAYLGHSWEVVEILRNATEKDFNEYGEFIL